MSASCRLCAQPLQNGFLLTDMPTSAQGFAISESEALSCAAVMEIFQCSMCGLVQYPGPLVPYYKEVIRASKNSNHMMNFRKTQFRSLVGSMGFSQPSTKTGTPSVLSGYRGILTW